MSVPRRAMARISQLTAVAVAAFTLMWASPASALLIQYYAGSPGSDYWRYSAYVDDLEGGRADMTAYVLVKVQTVYSSGAVYSGGTAPKTVTIYHSPTDNKRSRCQWYLGSPGADPGDNVLSCSYRL